MGGEVLLDVDGLSKKYCRTLKRSLWYGVLDIAADFHGRSATGGQLRQGEFWALRDISFRLERGQCLGLIGRNGAGKSTLLKLLNGLMKPDSGKISVTGRVGGLIALGAGFNPVLTGRENVYINASLLGLSRKEIDRSFDDIVDFSGIEEFIDMPVQSYSSGMLVRLGFAVATALKPDVLLLDEVLAVGDASFRHKCYHRINSIIRDCAVILVSHSMDQIGAVSSLGALLSDGRMTCYGGVHDAISAYNLECSAYASRASGDGEVFATYPPVRESRVSIQPDPACYREHLEVTIDFVCDCLVDDGVVVFTAVDETERPVMNWSTRRAGKAVRIPAGRSRFIFRIHPLLLNDGVYNWSLWVSRKNSIEALVYAVRAGTFAVRSVYGRVGDIAYLPDSVDFAQPVAIDP